MDGELLQAVGVVDGGAATLLYERHRTWKGLFTFAPKHEPVREGNEGDVAPAAAEATAPTGLL
jgi:hypothetical protein